MAIERMASEAYVDGKVGVKYTKPQGGIPATDMSGDVQALLAKADTALQRQDISGKADRSTTYTKSEVDSIVQALKGGSRVVVQSLPQAGEAMKIYMVAKQGGQSGDAYDEYIWTADNTWERIGSTTVDLKGYAKLNDLPTKTSQLTNDGDGTNAFVKMNDTRLSDARTPTAHHATHAAGGSDPLAPADIGAASSADLPYRLVEPGKWEFSDSFSHVIDGPIFDGEYYWYYIIDDSSASQLFETEADALAALSLTFDTEPAITATRASLPGHLCDRAGNRVVVSGDTTLTLPAAVPGYMRDLIVRLDLTALATAPEVTFAAPTGETVTFETEDGAMPELEAGKVNLVSLTETDTGVIDVAHKTMQEVG